VILALSAGLINLGNPSRLGRAVIIVGAMAQVAIVWWMPPSTPQYHEWVHAVLHG
jgi:hypothetical protein